MAEPRLRARTGLTSESFPIGLGLLVSGASAYGFLVLSGRALGPELYAPLSVLWALVVTVGPGLFAPFEQELARSIAHRRSQRRAASGMVTKTWIAGCALVVLVTVVSSVSGPLVLDVLLDGDVLLGVAFLGSIVGYYAQHLGRGMLLGEGRMRQYGAVLAAEGAIRLAGAALLTAMGVRSPAAYGLVLGFAPLLSAAFAVHRPGQRSPEDSSEWGELARAVSWLVLASLCAQLLANAGPIAVKVLAPVEESPLAGSFMAALVVARVPVFLFFAVQAALLPRLAFAAGAGRMESYRATLRLVLAIVAGLGTAMVVGAFAVGPWLVGVLFGPAFVLGRVDLAMLALASAVYMGGLVLAQALIALHAHQSTAKGWLVGAVAFMLSLPVAGDLLLRIELALVVGSLTALAFMAVALRSRLGIREAELEAVDTLGIPPAP